MRRTPTGIYEMPYIHPAFARATRFVVPNLKLAPNPFQPLALRADLSQQGDDPLALKNYIINGDFQIWQRGNTINGEAGASKRYLADRWAVQREGTVYNYLRQQHPLGQTDVPDSFYYAQIACTSAGSGATHELRLWQQVEDITKLAGKTVALSFYAKADAAKTIYFDATQDFGEGGNASSDVNFGAASFSLTTTWQRFTHTFTVPSLTGKVLGTSGLFTTGTILNFWLSHGNAFDPRLGTSGGNLQTLTLDITNVQLELGNSASSFEVLPSFIEASFCQRYCQVLNNRYNVHWGHIDGNVNNGMRYAWVQFPTEMRVSPSISGTTTAAINNYAGLFGASARALEFHVKWRTSPTNWNSYYNFPAYPVTLDAEF